VKPSTSASESQPSGNTKNDRIQRQPSSTQKNKVEAHPRTDKSSLKNKNCAVEPKGTYLDSGCSKHMTRDRSQLINFVNKFLGTVKLRNDHVAKIMGYGDYQIGNVMISRVYYVEGLGHNLFFVGKLCDSNLEVAFRQHTGFIRNLEGVDLLIGSQGNNLYTLSLGDMMASSPILARLDAIRIFLAFAAHMNMIVYQMDVKMTFLNDIMREEVYVSQPDWFMDKENLNHVYKLKKALYGLKQAPRA
nr:retrovirus-related Pol polyprotein from transposon TNT 1-94 [Tanacetum cinerariifolium]